MDPILNCTASLLTNKALEHHFIALIHKYLQFFRNEYIRNPLAPPSSRGGSTTSVYKSNVMVTKTKNKGWEKRPFFLYNVHGSYNKVWLV